MNATIQYLLFDLAFPAGSVLVILLAVLRFFGEKIFGHVLDRRTPKTRDAERTKHGLRPLKERE